MREALAIRTGPIALLLSLGLCGCASAGGTQLDPFEAELARQDSATLALEQWCETRGFAEQGLVTASAVDGPPYAPSQSTRAMLEVSEEETIGYRHVQLSCGGRVLSDAHNWFVPSRLTAEMNHTLETTNTPFGKAVAELHFSRERMEGARGTTEDCPADTILYHRAVLRRPDGQPISLVVECYTPENLR